MKNEKIFSVLVLAILFLSCDQQKEISAQNIVDKSIEVSGGDKIKNATIAFNFRDKHYRAKRSNGQFQLERTFKDSIDIVKDVLSNNGYERFVNNKKATVPDSMIPKYTASVNSVHYFSVLPFGLNDTAVNKHYIEKVTLKGEPYHKLKITFNQDGGGEDFEDVFVYWIHAETNKTGYIAYSYQENQGTGLRFREAHNERYVKAIRFVDYVNYKPNDTSVSVLDLDGLFEKNELQIVSKINLEDIEVQLNAKQVP